MSFNNTNTDILVAGAFAAFSVDLLVYPLDTIKTRLQSREYKRLYTNATTGTANRTLFRGLYQGIGSVILATVPSSGAFFTTYEATKSILTPTPLPTPVVHSLASSTGELVSCLILTPAEVLKQNAQMVSRPTSSPHPTNPTTSTSPSGATAATKTRIFDTNATVIALRKFSSPRQLWRGYTALAGRNLPFTAMHFPLFEHLRARIHAFRRARGRNTGTLWETGVVTAVSAGTAGSVAAVATTPIDVVKTRIMLSAPDDDRKGAAVGRTGGEEDRKRLGEPDRATRKGAEVERAQMQARMGRAGGWAVGREVLRTEGVEGLFRGGALRGVWTALGSGLYLGVYESGRKYLENRRTGEDEGTRI